MTPRHHLLETTGRLVLTVFVLSTSSLVQAQLASTPPDAAALAKYDRNKNGQLDADEVASMKADEAKTRTVEQTGPAQTSSEVIELSPFKVSTEKDSGYFAENTLAGSRMKTNLADIAASISVVTKQQMEDTAAIDINDVFKYEANTEGSGTYQPSIVQRGTAVDTIGGYTSGGNGDTTTNAQSNRVRGLNAPDAAINNFSTNNRIPFDAYNTQSIEISRGPNSLLFGLGTPAGVVNQNASQAILNRATNTVSVRVDQNGSYRSSLAVSRPLINDKLAVMGALLYDNRQFERKPSRDLYRRQYGALTYKPFKNTSIRGFAENYQNDANRPNFFTPRDQVTPWLQSGRPVYDPLTRMVTVQGTGRTYGPYVSSTLSPGYLAAVNNIVGVNALTTTASNLFVPGIMFDDVTRPIRRIDNGAVIDYIQRQPQFYTTAFTNPATSVASAGSLGWTTQDPRYLYVDRFWASSTALPAPTTTINGTTYTYSSWQNPAVTNKSIYDWTRYNTNQENFDRTHAANYSLEVEQQLLPNLFFNAAWLRQDIDEASNLTMGSLTGATLRVDTQAKMIDGATNPYFGLPFLLEGEGGGLDTFFKPETDDNYRAMLAYDLDLTKNKGWTRWLGHHRLLSMWSEQDVLKANERWRMNIVDASGIGQFLYTRNLLLPSQAMWSNTNTYRRYYMASPGAVPATVTHSQGFYGNQGWQTPVTTQMEVWNQTTNQFEKVNITERLVFSNASSFKTQREVKGTQFALQSYLWEDRLVSTLGWRRDNYRARITTTGAITKVDGTVVETALPDSRLYTTNSTGEVNRDLVMNRWNRWDKLSGDTKTLGAAFRPLRGLKFAQQLGGDGSVLSEFVQGLTFYYNQSNNFNPPSTFQTDYFWQPLPKPTGKGRDGGFGFSLFGNKLVARLNWYDNESLNERTNAAVSIMGRIAYLDTTTGLPWANTVLRIRNAMATGKTLEQVVAVTNWNSDTVNNVSDEANQRKAYDLLKLPYLYYSGISTGATQDSKAKGVELQLTYNPTRNWTMKVTGSKSEATYKNIAPQYDTWKAVRMPVWTTIGATEIPDFTDYSGRRYSLKNYWNGYGFNGNALAENTDGNTSPAAYFNNVVQSQVALAKALEGAVSPMLRKYHASFLTNYTFRDGRIKGFSVGGSGRWESKAAIGFYGKAGDPTLPTVINLNDVTRPIYDKGNYYADVWCAYSRKIFGDRIGWKLQLNINNVNESGRLLPTQVNFDGTPWAYRIIDPRQFILTSTFTF